MKDIFGKAIEDYFAGNYTEDIVTITNITEEDIMSLPYLFRDYKRMPILEQTALNMSYGKVLDVGCGAGSHSLYLQNKGLEVWAIDYSEGAINVCKKRGILHAAATDILNFKEGGFDTILLLMNGTGIFQSLKKMPVFLKHLKTLLNPNGQILIDSSDLIYMYEVDEDGFLINPFPGYYGHVQFIISYKGEKSEPFDWLYLDEIMFEKYSKANGYNFEIVKRGHNYNYLAKLTLK